MRTWHVYYHKEVSQSGVVFEWWDVEDSDGEMSVECISEKTARYITEKLNDAEGVKEGEIGKERCDPVPL